MLELSFEKPVIDVEKKIEALKKMQGSLQKNSFPLELRQLDKIRSDWINTIYSNLSPWEITQVARHPNRPTFLDYVHHCIQEFTELHGDRKFGDDPALVCGLGYIDGVKVLLIGHQKGKNLEDNLYRNFGMSNPEGYRKALRLMKLAEKFNRPIITFIDTPGAYPGIEAEERGQSQAIAENLFRMSQIKVPIITVVTGEGGSGGALGIAVADKILMLSNSIYSVISPEGCASILWRDSLKAANAAQALKLTAPDLLNLGVIDEIIQEPMGGAHRFHLEVAELVKDCILTHLRTLQSLSSKHLLNERYCKWISIGSPHVFK